MPRCLRDVRTLRMRIARLAQMPAGCIVQAAPRQGACIAAVHWRIARRKSRGLLGLASAEAVGETFSYPCTLRLRKIDRAMRLPRCMGTVGWLCR